MLINVSKLISQYYLLEPDPDNDMQIIKFGTSGHRGSSKFCNFNEKHILAISQAIIKYRTNNKISGPCYVGKDTHALSEPAFITVLEVLTANCIQTIIEKYNDYTPTPHISCAILNHNFNQRSRADGIIITSSHNPPEYGGIKYNTPEGGPSNIFVTNFIEKQANKLLKNNLRSIKRLTIKQALKSGFIYTKNLTKEYVMKLSQIINMQTIKKSKLKLGIDPLGGAGIYCWQYIAQYYKLNLDIINENIDPTFSFINPDFDGKSRIDCASKYSIKNLLPMRKNFDLLFTNDPDNDRHGIITPNGIMDTNQYLAVAINYLFRYRSNWNKNLSIGKTFVSSSIIDKVVNNLNRRLIETPVGFKWFVNDFINGILGFSCEESAGASFLCFNQSLWSTDKDGIIMSLLAAELTAITGKNPQQHYEIIKKKTGITNYNRMQINTNLNDKKIIIKSFLKKFNTKMLADDRIIEKKIFIFNNKTIIDGIKITTKNGWFAIRSSGTEENYKLYCESFINMQHREQIEKEVINFLLKLNKNLKISTMIY